MWEKRMTEQYNYEEKALNIATKMILESKPSSMLEDVVKNDNSIPEFAREEIIKRTKNILFKKRI